MYRPARETFRIVVLMGFVFLLGSGCGEPLEVPVADPASQADSQAPSEPIDATDLEPQELEIALEGASMLLQSASIGVVENDSIRETLVFDQDDEFAARITANEVPEGLVARMVVRKGDETIAESQEPIPASRTVVFSRPSNLGPGDYTVELLLGGNVVHSADVRFE